MEGKAIVRVATIITEGFNPSPRCLRMGLIILAASDNCFFSPSIIFEIDTARATENADRIRTEVEYMARYMSELIKRFHIDTSNIELKDSYDPHGVFGLNADFPPDLLAIVKRELGIS